MSNANNEQNAAPAADQAPAAGKPKGFSSLDVYAKVGAAIVTAAPRALESVVKTLVDREIEKRSTALLGAVELASSTRTTLNKAKEPDVRPTLFTADGKPIGEPGWSKQRLAEIKKLTEKLAKIDKAIDAATREENPDFSLLNNLKSEIEKAEKAAAANSSETETA